MKLINLQTVLVGLFLFAGTFGCGPKQPPPEAKSPEPVLPNVRTCPGALGGENIQVTTAIGESNSPVVTWTGDAFSVAWWDLRGRFPEVHTVRLDRSGTRRSPAKKMPNTGRARHQSIAWDGKEVHLVWRDDTNIMSARLGSAEDAPKVLFENGAMPTAGAWGAAAWIDKGNLYFRSDGMINPEAEENTQPEPAIIATGGIEDPKIAYNGTFYAVVWSASKKGGREILLQRVSLKGRKLGKPVHVSATAGVSRKPIITWTGKDFAVAWTNAAPTGQNPRDRFRVFFAVVPDVGDMPSMTRQLKFSGSADQVALAATGKEFGLAWVGSRKPVGTAVYLQRIGLDGNPIDETMEVTDGVPLTCGRPDLAWAGDGYGVVWHDDRAKTGAEVFFAFVECGEELPEIAEPKAPVTTQQDAGTAPPTKKTAPEKETASPKEKPKLKKAFDDTQPSAKQKKEKPKLKEAFKTK